MLQRLQESSAGAIRAIKKRNLPAFIQDSSRHSATAMVSGLSWIHLCARDGFLEGVEYLCKTRYLNPNFRASSGSPHFAQTPLHFASQNGREEVIEFLLSCGADPTLTDENGRLPRGNLVVPPNLPTFPLWCSPNPAEDPGAQVVRPLASMGYAARAESELGRLDQVEHHLCQNRAQAFQVEEQFQETQKHVQYEKFSKFRIPAEQLRIIRLIGQGGWGKVFVAEWIGRGGRARVAVKEIDMSDNLNADHFAEFKTISTLHHPNVLRIFGYSRSNQMSVRVVMEECDMSLRDLVNQRHALSSLDPGDPEFRPFTFKEKYDLIYQCTRSLLYLHSRNIVHRDLKAANYLVNIDPGNRPHLKVCDFGLSKTKTESKSYLETQTPATKRWMAPESFSLDCRYSKYSDVWSLAMTFWEVFHESLPFEKPALVEYGDGTPLPSNYSAHTYAADMSDGNHVPVPKVNELDCPESVQDYLRSMLSIEYHDRPLCEAILQFLISNREVFEEMDRERERERDGVL